MHSIALLYILRCFISNNRFIIEMEEDQNVGNNPPWCKESNKPRQEDCYITLQYLRWGCINVRSKILLLGEENLELLQLYFLVIALLHIWLLFYLLS